MTKYPSQLQDKFNLRLPDGMRDAIAERAKSNGRSMNSEIIQILQDAIDDSSSLSKRMDLVAFINGDKGNSKTDDIALKLAGYVQKRTEEFQHKLLEDLKVILKIE
ncbi:MULTISPECIES: Arc family DNA-binding protein [Enterobacter]|uniref:Arc family DNA-binding protein n=1 Tax=Enterobacter TaxID=547 RepID=UPI0028E70C62|nr:Arc family DNA-binding protein [Enterobacter cloacae]WNT38531.1 Arc family DNA-binding protein [Enterobacter cloacae]HDR2796283.1 Arc family DNA-binding protein [Enterobacter asburiae]HDR2801705.1 Arc family DNA-binding protein [Enterobacter asburiae]